MMEKGCNIIVALMMSYIFGIWHFDQGWTAQNSLISGALILNGVILWSFSHKSSFLEANHSVFRPKTSSGLFMVFLVPMALMSEITAYKNISDKENGIKQLWLSLVSLLSITARLMVGSHSTIHLCMLVMALLTGVVLVAGFGWISVLTVSTFCSVWNGLELIPHHLPKSFTFGELATVLQLLTGWTNRIVLAFDQAPDMTREDFQLSLTVNTVMIAIALAVALIIFSGSYTSLLRFLAVYMVMALLSLTVLHFYFDENPIAWLLKFILGSSAKIGLLVTWLILFIVAVIWTVCESLNSRAQINSSETSPDTVRTEQTSQSQVTDRESSSVHPVPQTFHITTATRKVFHVFIVLVYIPGLVLDRRLLLIASVAAFGLFIILESARALRVPVIGEHLDEILRTFVDERDQGFVFLTHIYLLLGLSLPLWMSHKLFSGGSASLEMYSGVLSLGVGDTVACVAGRAVGKIFWPGSKKTVEGTSCSILSQILLVLVGVTLGIVSVNSISTVFLGVILSALVEAFTDQIDNLVLPLVLFATLCLQ